MLRFWEVVYLLLRDLLRLCDPNGFITVQGHYCGQVKRCPERLGSAHVIRIEGEDGSLYIYVGHIHL